MLSFESGSSSATSRTVKSSSDTKISPDYISECKEVSFPAGSGNKSEQAFALVYMPKNKDYRAPKGELPPVLLGCHGGPSAAASSSLNWVVQYYTSRGFVYVDGMQC